jgi:lysozyme
MKSKLEEMLIRQEGNRKFPYECTAGKLTIGVGRNLDDMGLTEDEVLYLLDNDIQRCDTELLQTLIGILIYAERDKML